MKKRIFSILLTICMLLTLLPISALATGETTTNVAKIGTNEYATLDAAITAANAGDTITLLTDVTLSAAVAISKSLTIDGGNHTITGPGVGAADGGNAFKVAQNGDLTLKNTKITNTHTGIRAEGDGAKLTVDTCDITSKYYSIGVRNINQVIAVTNSTLTGWAGIMTSAGGITSTENANTSITLTNTNVNSVSISNAADAYGGIVLQQKFNGVTFSMTGGKIDIKEPITGQNADNTAAFDIRCYNSTVTVDGVTITRTCTTNGTSGVFQLGNQTETANATPVMTTVTAINMILPEETTDKPWTYFDIKRDDGVSKVNVDYVSINGEKYIAQSETESKAGLKVAASITTNGTTTYYATLADAVTAANAATEATTIKLLADVTTAEVLLINNSVTIEGGNHTITGGGFHLFTVADGVDFTLENLNVSGLVKGGRLMTMADGNQNVVLRNVHVTATYSDTLNTKDRIIGYGNGVNTGSFKMYDSSFLCGGVDMQEQGWNSANYTRGISAWIAKDMNFVIENSQIKGFKYAVCDWGENNSTGGGNTFTITNSTIHGWAALSIGMNNGTYNITDSTLKGSSKTNGKSDNYGTIVHDQQTGSSGTTVNLTGGTIYANDIIESENAWQYCIDFRAPGVVHANGTTFKRNSQTKMPQGMFRNSLTNYMGSTFENCKVVDENNASLDIPIIYVALSESLTIAEGKTYTIPQGAVLEIPTGITLTNNGTIVNNGTITGAGTIENSSGTIKGNKPGCTVTGSGAVIGDTVTTANQLKAAIAAAKTGDTIKLGRDIDLSEPLTISNGAVLEGGSYTIKGTVNLQNGTIQNAILTNDEKAQILTIGSTNVADVATLKNSTVLYPSTVVATKNDRTTVSHTLTNNAATINIENTRFVNSGRSTTQWSYGLYINAQNGGTINYKNNTFDGTFRTMLPNINGNMTIEGNSFKNYLSQISYGPDNGAYDTCTAITTGNADSNVLVVKNNSFTDAGCFYFQKPVTFTNNTVKNQFEYYFQGKESTEKLDLTSNTFSGTGEIATFHSMTKDQPDYLKFPDGVQYSKWNLDSNNKWAFTGHFVRVSGVETSVADDDLQAAINNAASGATITLAKDIVLTSMLKIENKAVTINGNGHTISTITDFGTNNASKHLVYINGESAVTLKNVVLDSKNMAYGLHTYLAGNVTLTDVTIKNSKGAGLTVNGSAVTATNLTTSGNAWGAVNVDIGSDVAASSSFTLSGTNYISDTTHIWSDGANVTETNTVTVTATGYTKYGSADNTKAFVWATARPTCAAELVVGDAHTLYSGDTGKKGVADAFTAFKSGTLTICKSAAIAEGALAVPAGATLVIENGVTLDVTGTATFTNKGTLTNNGTLNLPPVKVEATVTAEKAAASVPETVTVVAQADTVIEVKKATTETAEVKTAEVTIPTAAATALKEAKSATIKTDVAEVKLDNTVLGAVSTAAGTSTPVTLSVEKIDKTTATLPSAIKNDADAVILDLNLKAGNDKVDFGGGTATITIPYKATVAEGMTVSMLFINEFGDASIVAGSTYDSNSQTVTFPASHFSLYATTVVPEAQQKYTMTVDFDKEHYNVGETVTATITAKAEADSKFSSFGFTINPTNLTRTGESTTLDGGLISNDGKYGYSITSTNAQPIAVPTTGVAIATITFTANAAGAANLALTDCEMTYPNVQINPYTVTAVSDSATVHDIQITLSSGANASFGGTDADIVAYAKYNEAGLWTTAERTTALTMPATITANTGYRLADKIGENLWSDGTTGYADSAAVLAVTWTENKTLTVQTVATQTISFTAAGELIGGTLDKYDAITVDKGTTLADAGLPTATPNEGYEFTGWFANGERVLNSFVVNTNITLTAKFAAKNFTWQTPILNNSTISNLTGVTNGTDITYGTPITFTATPNGSYVIIGVSYSVAGSATGTPITADASGKYTIPGDKILGNVKLEINTLQYHTVTFAAGDGVTSFTSAIAYVKTGVAGYYASLDALKASTESTFTLPTPTAAAGYRLPNAGESLWWNGNTGYTAAALTTLTFNADTTLTAKGILTHTVTFTSGGNGTVDPTTLTIDSGKTVTKLPTTNGNPGYSFKEWRSGSASGTVMTGEAILAAAVTADVTYYAIFEDATYTVTIPTSAAYTVTGNETAKHSTDYTFTVAANGSNRITAVTYQIGSANAVSVDTNGGTIPGNDITANITISVTTVGTHAVTFETGDTQLGTVTNGSFTIDDGSKITDTQLATVTKTPTAGYEFKHWYTDTATKTAVDPTTYTVTADTTFYAKFDHATYTVTAPAGVEPVPTTATHGTDYTFNVSHEGYIVTGVTATIGGTTIDVTPVDDGSYKIAGNLITGNITLDVTEIAGSFEFIEASTYKGLAEGTKILVFKTTDLGDGNTYQLSDGSSFVRSGKYNGAGVSYLKIVPASATEAQLAQGLKSVANAPTTLMYGDINGDKKVTPADAGLIHSMLHNGTYTDVSLTFSPTDIQRLRADITGNKQVTTNDIVNVLRSYVGLGVQAD